jgi:RND family efflux transporter MFP subunit
MKMIPCHSLTSVRCRRVAAVILTIICGGLLLTLACAKKQKEKTESIADIQKREGVPVRVMKVEKAALSVIEQSGGTAEGFYQATLNSDIPAKIKSIDVKVGDQVTEGQVLIKMDEESEQSPYIKAKAAYEQTEKSYQRVKSMVSEGAASQDVLDQMETALTVAKNNLDAANKMVNVIAPFAGTVVEVTEPLNKEVDRNVPLLTLATLDRIRVKMNVSEIAINKYKKGQAAFIVVDGDTVKGAITDVALSGYSKNHTFMVEATFSNPHLKIRPGMFVTVQTVVYKMAAAITLPIEAIATEGAAKSVFIVQGDLASQVPVKLGQRSGNMFEVVAGINPGDQVVIEGMGQLASGTKVKIIN